MRLDFFVETREKCWNIDKPGLWTFWEKVRNLKKILRKKL